MRFKELHVCACACVRVRVCVCVRVRMAAYPTRLCVCWSLRSCVEGKQVIHVQAKVRRDLLGFLIVPSTDVHLFVYVRMEVWLGFWSRPQAYICM